jgi:hypothetical protein
VNWLRRLGSSRREPTQPARATTLPSLDAHGLTPRAEALAPFRRTAYVPSVVPGQFGAGTGFGGQPYLAPGVSNPICPQCNEAMPLIVQIALDAQPVPVIAGAGLFQLFYCTRAVEDNACDAMLEGWEPFSEGHVARLAAAGPGGSFPVVDALFGAKRVTTWTPADDYANPEELVELGADVGEAHDDVAPQPLEGEKLGGWPAWIQGIEYPDCPRCGIRMELVLQIDSRKLIDVMWGDMGIGHVTQCPNDPDVLAFAWACS